ncbi:MAG: glucose-6-phosphate isomerase [Proteobacteria bacterium]|nr:glucose-6-phosphate isomerase [Desulfobacteraceae bacterium]MBU2521340.1 glucose-6-phosphate isomerase [Pseudomonadota bacterium]MBU3979882.1 glucose-6-phosphate isomerase [Pseudomonadota bacterium]MBU4013510.1 glucose-6-phosphate isomerase [Pseudomonadota bacterium]MBU4068113.1 glucose-6-phosphate isomerase [Pseudomonadota bacterium]
MTPQNLSTIPAWNSLKKHAENFSRPEKHLKYLIKENDRLEKFSLKHKHIFYDFSRQRVDEKAMSLLFKLAEARKLKERFIAMMNGEKINVSENRAALHTASRNFSGNSIFIDEKDVMPEIIKTRENIREFASEVHNGKIAGSSGRPFKHVVVIGIGGSYLGTEFVSRALEAFANKDIKIHFLSNVDIHNFGNLVPTIDPETTLWIVISKSYTTAETTANTNLAVSFMKEKGLDPSKHLVTVTSKGSPGDDPANPVLASFHMFDFIGGRYSVTSAVGGVPLSLYLGYDKFERFLKGAEEMDIHAKNAPFEKNIPLVAALISIWNNNFLGYQTQAIIPYASPLQKLAPHIQQLSMESNGKSVTQEGHSLDEPAGAVVFGEPGTNAQHSFFQLAHQGRPFPIEFIGVIKPQYNQYNYKSKGVTNHQELWANLISQPAALALGKEDKNKAKYFPGNRPSSTILINDLSPESVGHLLSFYEAKTVFEAFIWGINPFDQFGVELGKKLASDIRNELALKNEQKDHRFENMDNITKFYLDTLFSGKL